MNVFCGTDTARLLLLLLFPVEHGLANCSLNFFPFFQTPFIFSEQNRTFHVFMLCLRWTSALAIPAACFIVLYMY